MAANPYSTLSAKVTSELATLSGYTGILVNQRVWDPNDLPDFTKWAVIVSPAHQPWDESLHAIRALIPTFRIDLHLLVKNFHPFTSVYGTTSPDFGLFQLISDVKERLRGNGMGGLITRTYTEPSGPVTLDTFLAFSAEEKVFIHMARLTYVAIGLEFCPPTT